MASIIVKTGDHNLLNPTNIVHENRTILQHTLLRLFPNTKPNYFRLLRTTPGEEIEIFHEILIKTSTIVLRDDRGIAIAIEKDMDPIDPPVDLTLAIIRSLAISYEEASRRSPSLKQAIIDIPNGTPVYYIDSSKTTHVSFMYDGHKKPETGRLTKVKGNKNIMKKALERAKEAILSEETMALKVLTPSEAQEDLINLIGNSLKMDVIKDKDDWEMNLRIPVPLHKLYPYAFQTSRGFIRATHPGMLLPDSVETQFIKHIESVGKKIAQRQVHSTRIYDTETGEIPTSIEMREYGATEDIDFGDSTIIPITKANPYEMRSMYQFHKFRPKLTPVL
jgi:hypothetical protein